MIQPKKGDLIHIPADTYFFKVRLEDDCIKRFIVSKEPKVYLLADSNLEKYYKVMVNNDFWLVKKTDVSYNIRKEYNI